MPIFQGNYPGYVPEQYMGPEYIGQKALYASEPDDALLLQKMFTGGYGLIKAGTPMMVNASGGGTPSGNNGMLVPYVPTLQSTGTGSGCLDGTVTAFARPLALGMTNTTATFSTSDAARFIVGDELEFQYDVSGTPTYFDGGKITAIAAATANPNAMVVTFTNSATAVLSALNTAADSVGAYVKCFASSPFKKAVYICDQDVDTGLVVPTNIPGVNTLALGGFSSVVVSNALLRQPAMINFDAQAITDLGCIVDGMLVVLK